MVIARPVEFYLIVAIFCELVLRSTTYQPLEYPSLPVTPGDLSETGK